MRRGELLDAVEEGSVPRVRACIAEIFDAQLSTCSTRMTRIESIDDSDDRGRTALMAAARGAGRGGEDYASIIKILWKAYKDAGANLAHVLKMTDRRHHWNVLMHSAKCGDAANLTHVLGLYTKEFGSLSSVEDDIDWANVDSKVKDIISTKVFSGEQKGISNYSTRSPRTSRNTRNSKPTAVAAASASSTPSTSATSTRTRISKKAANKQSTSHKRRDPKGKRKPRTPQTEKAASTKRRHNEEENDEAYNDGPAGDMEISNGEDSDATTSSPDHNDNTSVPETVRLCQEELKRARSENKRQSKEIERLKAAIRALTG